MLESSIPTPEFDSPRLHKIRRVVKERRLVIHIEKDGDSYYSYCPALAGIHIDGETKEEALNNIIIAIKLYIESLIDHDDLDILTAAIC
jgi:predicted RNase H-like HicB family nuclease